MKNIIYLLIITCLVFTQSCQDIVEDFEIEEKDPKIVLNTKFYADSIPQIHLSKSSSINDHPNTIIPLKEATVEVSDENGNKTSFSYDKNGFYINNNFIVAENTTYIITASNEGMETISAEIYVPSKPELVFKDTNIIITSNNCLYCMEEKKLKFTFEINDDKETTDYYIIQASANIIQYEYDYGEYYDSINQQYYSIYEIVDSSIYYQLLDFETYSPSLKMVYDYANIWLVTPDWIPSGKIFYYSDELIKGSNTTVVFNQYFWHSFHTIKDRKITFNLIKISEDYFKYMQTRARENEIDENPFVEDVTPFNNIKNGLGHAMGACVYKIDLDLSAYNDDFIYQREQEQGIYKW